MCKAVPLVSRWKRKILTQVNGSCKDQTPASNSLMFLVLFTRQEVVFFLLLVFFQPRTEKLCATASVFHDWTKRKIGARATLVTINMLRSVFCIPSPGLTAVASRPWRRMFSSYTEARSSRLAEENRNRVEHTSSVEEGQIRYVGKRRDVTICWKGVPSFLPVAHVINLSFFMWAPAFHSAPLFCSCF